MYTICMCVLPRNLYGYSPRDRQNGRAFEICGPRLPAHDYHQIRYISRRSLSDPHPSTFTSATSDALTMSARGPTWQRDLEVSSCNLCRLEFSFFNRRHHCRICGLIVCASCSAQPMNWYGGPVIVGEGKVRVGVPGTYYRTCDRCMDEFRRMSADGGMLYHGDSDNSAANNNNTKYVDVRTRSNTVESSTSSSTSADTSSRRDTSTDDNLCPVCATDLNMRYANEIVRTSDEAGSSSHEQFERFKETHISQCLTDYDFDTNHDRFASPTDHPRNKMLVYNIPPIPRPKYESIVVNGLEQAGPSSYAETVAGSVTSNSTVMPNEKREKNNEDDMLDNECVICLEELKPGDKVGRLECLCVFHYKCIKDWFNKKGFGECPVHFLHL